MSGQTKRLYFEDSYRIDFEAEVIEETTFGDKPALILERTCFYPESGGQPSDRGTINGIEVVHVVEENGRIIHVLTKNVDSAHVKGKIDWERRFDHMQQHAGQHILSQCFERLLEAKTLSFHLGQDVSTVEVDLREISGQSIEKVEKMANDVVFQDRAIKTRFHPEEDIQNIAMRKPPQKKGTIRIVEIQGFDTIACGGTHPRRTGEIGLIKILRGERIRNNIRLDFISGGRALRDYSRKHRDLRYLSNQLTVDEGEVPASIEKLMSELKAQKKKSRKIQKKLIQYEAQEMIQNAEKGIIRKIFSNRSPEEVKTLALSIIKKGDYVVLFGVQGEPRVQMVFASSESLGLDMRELLSVVAPLINGRGGGRPSLVEMAGDKKENLDTALDKAYEKIRREFIHSGGR